MNEVFARQILGHWIKSDDSLGCTSCGIYWNSDGKENPLVTDSWNEMTPAQREAVTWWTQHMHHPKATGK